MGRTQGHSYVRPARKGGDQAHAVARRLTEAPLDAGYCSDLSRAGETASIINGERDIPLHATPELRERDYGVFEGLTVEERKDRYPGLFAASLVKDQDFAPTGGESPRATSVRMTAFVAGLKARHPDETVLIVGHGGSLRAVIIALMEFPLDANWRFVMSNCSLSVFDTYPDNAVLRLYNDTSHLGGLVAGIPGIPGAGV